jgi:hypothetical protein
MEESVVYGIPQIAFVVGFVIKTLLDLELSEKLIKHL